MQTVSLGVAHGPDELVEVFDGGDVVEELVEDGDDGDGVRLGANTSVVVADGGEGDLTS